MTMGVLGTIVRSVDFSPSFSESSRAGERTGSHFLLNGDRNWELELRRGRVLCETVYQFTELPSAGCGAAQVPHT